MNRRKFVNSSLWASAGALHLANTKPSPVYKYKLGYQLFSVNKDMNRDPFGTLVALKEMGYEDFEIYGFDADAVTYYGHPATQFKQRLDEMGLTCTSGHYGFAEYLDRPADELRTFVDQCIKGAETLNTPYITWPWISEEQRTLENYKKMAYKLNLIGEQINAAGLGFSYHNHGFEFEDHDGDTCYDIIIRDTDADLVKLQIDMYWVMHSSDQTPKDWVKKDQGRFVMWHIKDMDKITRDYTELGNGSIDYKTIMPIPEDSGLQYYYLEQGGNFAVSAMQSAATSAEYFKKHLQKLLP